MDPWEIDPDEELLFHYTTFDGLLGILEQSVLRATDIRYLNDFTESANVSDLLSLGRQRALELIADDPDETAADSVHQTYRHVNGMVHMMEQRSLSQNIALYVACFSKDGDSLSLWRGYGNGGVALGFSRDAVDALPSLPGPTVPNWSGPAVMEDSFRPRLVPVQYGGGITQAGEVFANSLADVARTMTKGGYDQSLQSQLEADAMAVVAGLKNEKFEDELEVRLVVNGSWAADGLDRFRVGPLGLVPYVEIPLDLRTCLRSVVIGPPRMLSDGRKEAVGRLLRRHALQGLRPVSVIDSEVPFR